MRTKALKTLIFAAVMSRLIPHPWNFTAVGASALFAGAMFSSRWLAMSVPLAAMLVGDLFLAATVFGWTAFNYTTIVVYACMMATAIMGRGFGRSIIGVGTGSLLSALVFFFATNLSVWLFSTFYPPTGTGLFMCYAAAVPYAWNMLAANVLFSALLFGGWAIAERRIPQLAATA